MSSIFNTIFLLVFSFMASCQHFKRSNAPSKEIRGLAALGKERLRASEPESSSLNRELRSGKLVAAKAVVYRNKKPFCAMDLTKRREKVGQIGWTAGPGFSSKIHFRQKLPLCSSQVSSYIRQSSKNFRANPQVAIAPFYIAWGALATAGAVPCVKANQRHFREEEASLWHFTKTGGAFVFCAATIGAAAIMANAVGAADLAIKYVFEE